jgi:RHS repeat-associated protein
MYVSTQPSVLYTYDVASRLRTITQAPQGPVTLDYDALGRRTLLTHPNGVSTEIQYDGASRLTALIYRNATGILGDLNYQYDQANNRTGVGGDFARTLLPSAVAGASYNAANQQVTFDSQTLTYDLNGNLTSDGTNIYTWNARNELASLSGPSTMASFTYDALERRQSRVVNGLGAQVLYDGLNLIDTAGTAGMTALLTGPGIDEYMARTTVAAPHTFLLDVLGSIVAIVDGSGIVETNYIYEPFGTSGLLGGPDANELQYTGRELDGTGLYYYRARYYHPIRQRFISEDPIGFVGGDVNFYAYVRNQPTRSVDPLGLSQDKYVPDMHKHGYPHVDRYNPSGQNVGRYRHDGTPISHHGRPSPRVPNSDAQKFAQALAKLQKLMKAAGFLGIVLDILLYPDAAGAGSECPAGTGTCGAGFASGSTDGTQMNCLSGRKGVC